MRSKTRKITISAVLAALSVTFLYISSLLPSGQIGFAALASVCGIAAVIEAGIGAGAAVYVVSSVIGFLIVPNKNVVIIYAVFFGYYPVVKSLAEKLKNRIAEWLVKFLIMNIALSALLFAFSVTIMNLSQLDGKYVIIYILFNAAFLVFDIGISRVASIYDQKIHNKNRR